MSRDKTQRISADEYRALTCKPLSNNKYNAKGMRVDGIWFDSTVEANRYKVLKTFERAGYICALRIHPRYTLTDACEVNGVKQRAVEYEADFEYEYNGIVVTEDVKGYMTAESKRKLKQFAARYGRRVRVVTEYDANVGP